MAGDAPATLLAALRALDGEAPALETGEAVLPLAALLAASDALAGALAARGVAAGDRVLIELGNEPAHLVAVLGVWGAGAIAVPLDPRSGRRRRARIARRTGAVLALGSASQTGAAPAADASAEASPLPVATLALDGEVVRLDAQSCPPAAPAAPARSQAVAAIRFTSGSTGEPLGAVLDHAAQLASARLLVRAFALAPGHRELLLAPLAHSGAWQRAAATLLAGGCLLLPEHDAALAGAGLLDDLGARRAHGCYAPPPLWRALLRAPDARAREALAFAKTLEVGSAAIAPHELTALLARAPAARVHVHYGLTECSRASLLDARAHPDRLASVGRASPGVEIEIVDAAGRALPAGEEGEIRVRGPQLARGYWQDPEASAARFAGGWLRTGDVGVLDAEGFLFFRGRRDERIDCGGHGFFPAEVEAELAALPGVREHLVAGVPDPRGVLGQVPWLFAVPEDPARFDAAALLALARRRLPAYMVPRRVLAVPSLPRAGPGKPDRRRAVELYASEASDPGASEE